MKEILINRLFAGKYLEEGENIGHEVINLFKDDNGNNNLFITSNGSIDNDHDVEYVLFVRHVSKSTTVEVICLAEGIYRISDEEMNRIRYAGVSLNDIFRGNTYRGEKDSFSNHVTYRAKNVRIPSKRIFITIDNEFSSDEYVVCLQSEKKVVIPENSRSYYSSEKDIDAYHQLIEVIENSELWETNNTTNILIPDGAIHNQSPSFLEVIRKEDDENVFSNLIGYFFEYYPTAFQRFAAESSLFNIPDMRTPFNVERERKVRNKQDRIDLWIENEKDIIVIENKIKSGINGRVGKEYSQLNSYYEYAEEKAKESGKETHYFIFAPDYSRFDLARYGLEKVYKIIKYSDIYNFFIKESAVYIADRAFPDFVRGLKRHTLTLPDLRHETMRSRLLRKINQMQQLSHI